MKFTEEEFQVIGNPSERLVQEAVYYCTNDIDGDGSTEQALAYLRKHLDLTDVEARGRLMDAIADGEVGVTIGADGAGHVWLDPVTEARIERRYTYFVMHNRGSDGFHSHAENEGWHARCAIRSWSHDHGGDLPTWDDLVTAICDLLALDFNRTGATHIALNALDAGDIYMTGHPTRSPVLRFATTEEPEAEGLGL